MSELSHYGWSAAWQTTFDQLVSSDGGGASIPARVVEHQRDLYKIVGAPGIPSARVTGRMMHDAVEQDELPAVGDWVVLRGGRIVAVLPRRTAIVRKIAWRSARPQVVAANVDTVFIVTSANRDLSVRRLERYLALAHESGATPVIVLSKADLTEEADGRRCLVEEHAPGVAVHVVSGHTGAGMDRLEAALEAKKTAALIGSSGVGKSTLLNRLAGEELMLVREIRTDDDRGRHTTTFRRLVRLPNGALLVDTPGLREVALWDGEDGIEDTFADIEEITQRCRFRDCTHEVEPGCAILEAREWGNLDERRFEHWRELKKEQARVRARVTQRRRRTERRPRTDE